MAVHVGQPEVAALGSDREFRVVDAEQVQHRGVEVVNAHRVLRDPVAEVVGGAVGDAPLDATAGQPDREGLHVVVAAVALRHRRAAKLRAEDDERVVEHAAAGEILDERCGTAIDLSGRALHVVLHAAVMVPVAVIELDESHAPLGEPPGEQAVGGERAVAPFRAVEVKRAGRFVGEIDEVGHAGLHLECELILGQPRRDLRVAHHRPAKRVEPGDGVDHIPLPPGRRASRRLHVEHRVALGAKLHALKPARQQA